MMCSIRETITREVNFYRCDSIDSVVSNYATPVISTMEAAALPIYNLDNIKPIFIGSDMPSNNLNNPNNLLGNDYSGNMKSMGVGSAIRYSIYSGQNRAGYNNAGYKASIRNKIQQDAFCPDIFLKADKPAAQFIGSEEDIKDYVSEAFQKTMGKDLPDDIVIRVVSAEELKDLHNDFSKGDPSWSPGIQGFSINRRGFGQSLIFVKENDLDRLLITIGHEIGHVIKFPLTEKLDEEAKAFAFEMAWIKSLYDHNIANLRDSINPDPMPAKNGLHDVAFGFVKSLLLKGADAFDIFTGLMRNEIKVGENNVQMC